MKLFQQPEYIHVLLNHLPLTGLAVAALVLLAGMLLRRHAVMLLGLALVGLLSASALPVVKTGEKGYDRVLAMSDAEGREALEHHARLAKTWVKLYYVTSGIALLGIGAAWRWPRTLMTISLAVFFLALISLWQGKEIAEKGGEIRHREFRP
ncbi:MAG: hypothetical protein HY360_13485 [Verrucomicrobia bacterium]|nr:hypothetical protein [Verrucomicrobiota bacterium]